MARIPKEKVTYKVNLEDLFGERLNLTKGTRAAIGQAIIDRIVARTQDNLDKQGRSLGKYSKSYEKSLAGQVFGKKAGAPVNLTATSDMLSLLTIIADTPQTITIGWNDPDQIPKAYGHISGMKGHPVLDGKVQKRDFLGLPNKELDAIASDFEDQVRSIDKIQSAGTLDEFEQAILDTIEDIEGEQGIEPLDRALARQGG